MTPTLTPTPTYTATPTPTPTYTAMPTLTPAPTATPVPPPLVYTLLIATSSDDSLFVVNESAAGFPLGPLRLGDGHGAINGTDWGIETLANGACVTAWKDSGRPKPPGGVTCVQVGTRLTRSKPDRFWKSSFKVYYSGNLVSTCRPGRCSIDITVQP
jgi:hypothetical protein